VGAVSLRVRMQMSYKASLSMQKVSSEFSTSCYEKNVNKNACRKGHATYVNRQGGIVRLDNGVGDLW